MATLRVKNKYEVSFLNMIKNAIEKSGIPDYIDVNGKEAWELLNEIRVVNNGAFSIKPTDEYDPQFVLKSSNTPLTQQVAEDLVTRWWKREFGVVFNSKSGTIPVKVIPEKFNAKVRLEQKSNISTKVGGKIVASVDVEKDPDNNND